MAKRKGPTPKGGRSQPPVLRPCVYCREKTAVGLGQNDRENTANARHGHSPDLAVRKPICGLAENTHWVQAAVRHGLLTLGDPLDWLDPADHAAYTRWLAYVPPLPTTGDAP